MIVDPRIYASLYALLIPVYFVIAAVGMATIDNPSHQTRAKRALLGVAALLGLMVLINFYDWLWS